MFTLNQKISEGVALLATVDPVSQAVGVVNTGWVDHSVFFFLMALIDVGVFGAADGQETVTQDSQNGPAEKAACKDKKNCN